MRKSAAFMTASELLRRMITFIEQYGIFIEESPLSFDESSRS
jgi:hypothetical protein